MYDLAAYTVQNVDGDSWRQITSTNVFTNILLFDLNLNYIF